MKKLFVILLILCPLYNTVAQSHNVELVAQIHDIAKDCSYFEVTEEMFKMLAEDERLKQEEMLKYVEKISFLIFVDCPEDQVNFYDDFIAKGNLKNFKVLMRSKSVSEKFTFFRKNKNGTYEYLLLHNGGLSYIITTLKISTIQELSGIMNMVGELGAG